MIFNSVKFGQKVMKILLLLTSTISSVKVMATPDFEPVVIFYVIEC